MALLHPTVIIPSSESPLYVLRPGSSPYVVHPLICVPRQLPTLRLPNDVGCLGAAGFSSRPSARSFRCFASDNESRRCLRTGGIGSQGGYIKQGDSFHEVNRGFPSVGVIKHRGANSEVTQCSFRNHKHPRE
ncbi:hypothetical protein SAY86_007567 [Trapa natans]|uniref:Uncharacterized protein n=1 Tax=Trapa natans TaxID=22666 RepID=A0AAN7L8J7_TRANT|nr:hypothetical protein SAY86_007567 [Trapa natans]